MKAACVKIYAVMGLYEEAVELALQVDVDMAKMHANQCDVDDEVCYKNWSYEVGLSEEVYGLGGMRG